MSTKRSPVVVLISDIHYSLKTLEVADKAMRMAIDKAEELNIPLIVNGDLHDTKANLRGECTNAMIDTFQQAKCSIELNIGNHDKINEKSNEHSLNFLAPYCNFIVTKPRKFSYFTTKDFLFYIVPYYHDVNELRAYLKTLPKYSTLIMHQGLNGSDTGEYFNDHSALNPEDVQDFRVISGHYHRRQDIKTGRSQKGAVGLFSYIGNPYTLSFAESNDSEKGFQILYNDGTLEFVPTNLRKHVKIKVHVDDLKKFDITNNSCPIIKGDIVWVVVEGPSDKLATITKESVRLPQPFRLELISTDEVMPGQKSMEKLDFDSVIDSAAIDKDRKLKLKTLWKDLIEDTTSQDN